MVVVVVAVGLIVYAKLTKEAETHHSAERKRKSHISTKTFAQQKQKKHNLKYNKKNQKTKITKKIYEECKKFEKQVDCSLFVAAHCYAFRF